MAAPTPSSLFARLSSVWRHLSLRSDVDDIILELLGRFSLEKIYLGDGDREAYQQVVTTLLTQLNVIFYIQRLTLPSEDVQIGWYLGFIVSWEVAVRSVEFVLQVVTEGRESLWESRLLRDKYLAEFLLSALRVLALHPKAPSNHRARDRRDRFTRIHRSLEQVFDSYPGPKSFLLEVCKQITSQLYADPDALVLPPKLRQELPNLASELYPLPDCLLPPYITELAEQDSYSVSWLSQFLSLRDISHYVVGASIQYAVKRETRDVRLQSSSARSRNAVLNAVDSMRLPSHLSKMDLVASISATFRIVLPDTLDVSRRGSAESRIAECELDALDALSARLMERQTIHRVSDAEMMYSVSQVVRNILILDDPSGQFRAPRPSLYAVNCPKCHLIGGSQLKFSDAKLPAEQTAGIDITLPLKSRCTQCAEPITVAREIPLVRQTWETLRALAPDADTVNVERHLPTQFQLGPPRSDSGGLFNPAYTPSIDAANQRTLGSDFNPPRAVRTPSDAMQSSQPHPDTLGVSPSQFPAPPRTPDQGRIAAVRSDSSTYVGSKVPDYIQEAPFADQEPLASTEPPFSPMSPGFRKPSKAPTETSTVLSPTESAAYPVPRRVPIMASPEKTEKGKSKWKMRFTASKKPAPQPSGESSSLSSSAIEAQKLEEIPLGALSNARKAAGRGKTAKNINVALSQNSTFALFWTQLLIQIWDVGTSPPTMGRAIPTESTCILAVVGKVYLAYIIGTRDQKLTLRIMNLVQPSIPVAEYRMPSSLWCRSIAIDPKENYVVVGFENSIVRFFRTKNTEQPREDRLHSAHHHDCRSCPAVDTLAFSSDGLTLLGSTRSPKSGIIQLYSWRFPFVTFQELTACRYGVPLHESEDNGVSSAVFRSGPDEEDSLVCITTWTQSGTPMLIVPHNGHRSEVKSDASGRHGKLGNRVQCAAFSPSGRELAMVNEKGNVYQISNLNSSPMDIQRVATSKELTAKSESFAMAIMALSDEECIVLAWADPARATAWVKKVPLSRRRQGSVSMPETPGVMYVTAASPEENLKYRVPEQEPVELEQPPVELAATESKMTIDNVRRIQRKPLVLYDHKE